MSNLGAIVVSLEANIAKYQSDMGKAAEIAEQRMRQIDKSIGFVKNSLAVLGAGFLANATFDKIKEKIEGAITSAAGLKELSERTGASVEALSGLAAVAKLSGTDTDQLATGLQKLSKSMVDAESGGVKTTAAFNSIGISTKNLTNQKTEDVFMKIATQLDKYSDGANKTALTMALLGKSGANLLPVMKDLAIVGEYQTKVTTEQAEAALEYEQNLKRMEASTNAVYKVVALEAVPALNDFVKVMLGAQNQAGGLSDQIKKLAKDETLRDFFEGSAIFAAKFVDTLVTVKNEISWLIAANTVLKTIDLRTAFASGTAEDIKNNKVYQDQLKERTAALAVLNGASKKFFSDSSGYEDKLRESFAARKRTEDAAWGSEARRGGGKSEIKSGLDNSGKEDPAKTKMEGILKNQDAFIARAKKLADGYQQDLDFYARMQYMTEAEVLDNKKLVIEQELAASEGAYAIELAAANKFIEQEKALKNEKGQEEGKNRRQEVLNKQIASEDDARQKIAKILQDRGAIQRNFDLASNDVARQNGLANDAARFQIDLLGKNTLEVAKLTSAKAIQLALDERIRQARLKDADVDVSGAIAQAAIEQAQASALIEESYNKQRDASFGASEAIRKYGEDAANTGAQIESAMTNAFKNAEDALVNFCMTGKMDFKSFAMSVLADLDRMIIKEQLFTAMKNSSSTIGAIASMFGGMSTSTAAPIANVIGGDDKLGSFISLMGFASGGDPPLNVPSIVGENGPELFVPRGAGTIIPNDQLHGGGSGQSSQPVNITVNVNGNNAAPDVRRAAGQGAREALQIFSSAQRYS